MWNSAWTILDYKQRLMITQLWQGVAAEFFNVEQAVFSTPGAELARASLLVPQKLEMG
jgi:hypothetical protein